MWTTKRLFVGISLGLCVALFGGLAGAVEVVYLPTDDAYVDNQDPNTALGLYPNGFPFNTLYVGDENQNSPIHTCRTYLKFSLTGIPQGATITSASLELFASSVGPNPVIVVNAHSMNNDTWDESTITWNNAPTSYGPAIADSNAVNNTGWWFWELAAHVQGAHDDDGVYSVVLKEAIGQEGVHNNWVGFVSAEDISSPQLAPVLRVEYSIPSPEFRRGDSNDDGGVDIGDPVFNLAYLFNSGPSYCKDAQDSNGDNNVDLGDPIYTLAYLFSSGPQPPAPFPDCGVDPTPDILGCDTYTSCVIGKE